MASFDSGKPNGFIRHIEAIGDSAPTDQPEEPSKKKQRKGSLSEDYGPLHQEKMRKAALLYAQLGMAVFPLWGKLPAIPKEKGGKGFKDATTNQEKIGKWWDEYKGANIGTPTGKGTFALDIDARHNGEFSLDLLTSQYRSLPDTRTTVTGSIPKGYHLWFTAPEGMKIPTFNAEQGNAPLGEGIDCKGDGGYVVLPPSIHPDTEQEYAWDGLEGYRVPIAPAPEWLLALLIQKQQQKPKEKKQQGRFTVTEGGRNTFLFKRASKLRGEGHSEDYIIKALLDLNEEMCDPPLPRAEVERTARSGARYAPNPITLLPLVPLPPEPPDLIHGYLPGDTGNAQRMIACYGQNFKWDKEAKLWMVWNTRRWVIGDDTMARTLMIWTGIEYLKQASNLPIDESDAEAKKAKNEHIKRATLLQTASVVEKGIRQLTAYGVGQIDDASVGNYDIDPYLYSFPNGTLDLSTGKMHEHRREDLITKMLPFDYDRDAQCPEFCKWLLVTMGGNPDAEPDPKSRPERFIKFLRQIFGYALTGLTGEKAMFLFYGKTDTGKTTLLNVIRKVMGSYATLIGIDALLASDRGRTSSMEEQIYRLRGSRFALASEPEANARLSAARVKQLTQGPSGSHSVTPKYKGTVDFPETYKIFVDTNYKPDIRDVHDDIWNRLHVVEFLHQVPKDKQDKELHSTLYEERQGIMAWMVEGAREYLAQKKFDVPKEVEEFKLTYRKEVHPLSEFADECCELWIDDDPKNNDPEKKPGDEWCTGMIDLKNCHRGWIKAHGYWAGRHKDFKEQVLALRGREGAAARVEEGKTDNGTKRVYRGIRLTPTGEYYLHEASKANK